MKGIANQNNSIDPSNPLHKPIIDINQYYIRTRYYVYGTLVGLCYAAFAVLPFMGQLTLANWIINVLSFTIINACLVYFQSEYVALKTIAQMYSYRLRFKGGMTLTVSDVTNTKAVEKYRNNPEIFEEYTALLKNYSILQDQYKKLAREFEKVDDKNG